MKRTNIEIIKEQVGKASYFPDPTIEYNFDELPKSSYISPTDFYGVPAKFNKDMKINTANITYKF